MELISASLGVPVSDFGDPEQPESFYACSADFDHAPCVRRGAAPKQNDKKRDPADKTAAASGRMIGFMFLMTP
ncbi:MAG: hypothetical protein QM674_19305 [Burkholderiaceae bacterium]